MFWSKQSNKELIERVDNVESKLRKVQNDVLDIMTQQEVLRNKVLRRFQDREIEEEPTKSKKQPQGLNTFNPFA